MSATTYWLRLQAVYKLHLPVKCIFSKLSVDTNLDNAHEAFITVYDTWKALLNAHYYNCIYSFLITQLISYIYVTCCIFSYCYHIDTYLPLPDEILLISV